MKQIIPEEHAKLIECLNPALLDSIIRQAMYETSEYAEEKKDRKAAVRMYNYFSVWTDHI